MRLSIIKMSNMIASDGTTYVSMARGLLVSPREVIRRYDYHPGYPAAVAGANRLLLLLGWPDALGTWELAGQLVSLAASLAAMAAVWLFARRAFNTRVALIGALLFGIGRKWSALGADVLSDALAVCLQMWAVALAFPALDLLKRNSYRAVALAACVGLCCGLGYLVRPEALLPLVPVAALWLGHQAIRRARLTPAIAATGAAAAVALACALPYATAIGGLTKKKSLGDIAAHTETRTPEPAVILAGPGGIYSPPRKVLNQLFEALHPLVGFLACIWLAACVVRKVPRFRGAGPPLPMPRPQGAFMMAASAAMTLPILIGLYANVGYVSHRHVMFLAALLSPLGGAGAVFLADLAAAPASRVRAFGALRRLAPSVVVIVMMVGLAVHALRPLHADKEYFRDAGLFVGQAAGPDDYVLAENLWVLHYAEVPGEQIWLSGSGADGLLRRIHESKATHVVLSDRELRKAGAGVQSLLAGPELVEIRRFVQSGPERPDTVRVYRVSRGPAGGG